MSLTGKIALSLVVALMLVAGLACGSQPASGPSDKTWVSPGKVRISNLAAGGIAKGSVTIHNGDEAATRFSVYYRIPDYVEEGFVNAPDEAQDWFGIEEDSPILAPRETRQIPVVLNLPAGVRTPERWEFWIGVKGNKQGTLTTELCSRWLVTMKGK